MTEKRVLLVEFSIVRFSLDFYLKTFVITFNSKRIKMLEVLSKTGAKATFSREKSEYHFCSQCIMHCVEKTRNLFSPKNKNISWNRFFCNFFFEKTLLSRNFSQKNMWEQLSLISTLWYVLEHHYNKKKIRNPIS